MRFIPCDLQGGQFCQRKSPTISLRGFDHFKLLPDFDAASNAPSGRTTFHVDRFKARRVSFRFKTKAADGLLFFGKGIEPVYNHLILRLEKGKLSSKAEVGQEEALQVRVTHRSVDKRYKTRYNL